MSTYAQTMTAETVFTHMSPALLVQFISELTDSPVQRNTRLITLAVEALLATVGTGNAIALLAAADIPADEPAVADVLEKWGYYNE